jgi:hypothetical protein
MPRGPTRIEQPIQPPLELNIGSGYALPHVHRGIADGCRAAAARLAFTQLH